MIFGPREIYHSDSYLENLQQYFLILYNKGHQKNIVVVRGSSELNENCVTSWTVKRSAPCDQLPRRNGLQSSKL